MTRRLDVSTFYTFYGYTRLWARDSFITFDPYSMMGCSTVTDVSVVASAPTRTDIMTSPINVHMMPRIRAGIDLGDRSPYLLTKMQTKTFTLTDENLKFTGWIDVPLDRSVNCYESCHKHSQNSSLISTVDVFCIREKIGTKGVGSQIFKRHLEHST